MRMPGSLASTVKCICLGTPNTIATGNGSTWVVGAAKAGNENGFDLMGGSAIVAPTGEIVAEAETRDDELVVAECDLDACIFNKETIFDFAAHRRPEHYGLITERVGPSPN